MIRFRQPVWALSQLVFDRQHFSAKGYLSERHMPFGVAMRDRDVAAERRLRLWTMTTQAYEQYLSGDYVR